MSRWMPVTSRVTQGSLLGPLLFNIFVNNEVRGMERTLSKFDNDTNLNGAVHTTEEKDAIQRYLGTIKIEHKRVSWFYKT